MITIEQAAWRHQQQLEELQNQYGTDRKFLGMLLQSKESFKAGATWALSHQWHKVAEDGMPNDNDGKMRRYVCRIKSNRHDMTPLLQRVDGKWFVRRYMPLSDDEERNMIA